MQKAYGQCRVLLLLFSVLGLAGCDTLGYYSQAAHGQFSMLSARVPVTELLASEETDPKLKIQLEKAQRILAFAASQGLPVAKTYSEYVDLKRPFIVWNVFAAKADSIQLKSHCFPIAGCVGYKGYFKQADAQKFAEQLRAEGYDVFVGGVSAYSTLGWFNDPLLNTFLFRPDERLGAVLFHELAHKVFYLEGDTVFNESFATAVERHLLKQWLREEGLDVLFDAYLASDSRRNQVVELILNTRVQLAQIYANGLGSEEMQQAKAQVLADMKAEYFVMQETWGEGQEFAGWMAQDLNNAHLAAIGAYHAQVPAFSAMLQDRSLLEFFSEVEMLGTLDKVERDRRLAEHRHANQGDHPSTN